MSGRFMRRGLLVLAAAAVAVLLPTAGQSKLPPEHDGSGYTWVGAIGMTVDVLPWGGGYVRSDPYLIDCPMACVRPFEPNRDVKLTAYPTSGHTFKGWEGACAGQGNPCTVKVSSAALEVTAVFTGQFVPPAPPPPAPAPSPPPPPLIEVSPSLAADTIQGECPECFTTTLTGTGYHPNSAIDIVLAYVTPDAGTFGADDIETSDAAGSWTQGFFENCEFDAGTYSGPVVIDVTATDTEGASASVQVTGTCP
jgi:Divergent InlB B-repeat domain